MLKIKQVGNKCKRSGLVYLLDVPESEDQWVGDGEHFYPLSNIPHLEMENLIALFEIKEKQLDKISTNHISTSDISFLNFDDYQEGEKPVNRENIEININGVNYSIFITSRGVLYIDSSALSPLGNMLDLIELYERTETNTTYIVAKTGLIIQGVFRAKKIITPFFCDRLSEIARQTERKRPAQDEE